MKAPTMTSGDGAVDGVEQIGAGSLLDAMQDSEPQELLEAVEEAVAERSAAFGEFAALADRIEELERRLATASVTGMGAVCGEGEGKFGLEALVDALPALSAVGGRRDAALVILKRRVTAAEGRQGAPMLAKAVTRQLDYLAGEAELRTGGGDAERVAAQEARCALAVEMARRCALELELAAEALRRYGLACAEFAREKGDTDARLARKERITPGQNKVAGSRRLREDARLAFTRALNRSWLAASGGEAEA